MILTAYCLSHQIFPMHFFFSPSRGQLALADVIEEIVRFINQDNKNVYRLIIGTDSHVHGHVDFVNAIVVHRVGRGGRYFWRKLHREYKTPLELKARMFMEANFSIQLAMELLALLQQKLAKAFIELSPQVEVHIDIGLRGPTKDMIKELVGMVKGNGFEARIKPEAYAASSVADRYA